jgi:glycosyltransferase involved in cell wall biosynthesis
MRIAQVAPLDESVPPPLYGGTERVVSWLTEELVRLGHEVTLFASGDSQTAARLVPVCPRALYRVEDCYTSLPHNVRLMELLFRDVSRFDVIHFHGEYLHFPLLRRCPCPSVTTWHTCLNAPDDAALLDEFAEVPLVSISFDQRRPVPGANWLATVYHGLPVGLHKYGEGRGDYLAFLGRTSPEKRLDRALRIARASGLKLRIGAKVDPSDRNYFDETIAPLLHECGPQAEFLGEVGEAEKDTLLGNARALLFPIDWAEPFGLVMIEALACGTPVIAYGCGSVPEVLEDGVTGFIVESEEEAVRAVARLPELSRRRCRAEFERRFSVSRMAQDYVEVYRRLVYGAPARRAAAVPSYTAVPSHSLEYVL